MNVILRCNASTRAGFGHLVRCRALADRMGARGHDCIMFGPLRELSDSTDATRFLDWIERPGWDGADAEARALLDIAARHDVRHAVLDDYRSDGQHQLILRQNGLRCLQQYDASLTNHFAAQLVVHASPAERRADLEPGFLVEGIETLHGPAYAVLRAEFTDLPAPAPRPAGHDLRLLVSFGGGDDLGALVFIISILNDLALAGVTPVLMVSERNPNLAEVRAFIESHPGLGAELHVSPQNVPALMLSCDAALLAGGTTTYEVARCGLALALMPIVPNQYHQAKGWAALGAGVSFTPFGQATRAEITRGLNDFLSDRSRLAAFAQTAKAAVDSCGADRLIDRLLEIECE